MHFYIIFTNITFKRLLRKEQKKLLKILKQLTELVCHILIFKILYFCDDLIKLFPFTHKFYITTHIFLFHQNQ